MFLTSDSMEFFFGNMHTHTKGAYWASWNEYSTLLLYEAEFTLGKNQTIWLPLPCHTHSAPPLLVPSFSKQAAGLPEVASI